MNGTRRIWILLGAGIIAVAYFLVPWARGHWPPMGSLEALYSGLAFLVIYFTLLSQHRATDETLKKLEKQAVSTERLALAQALGLERQNVGSRIHFLKRLARPKDDKKEEAERKADLIVEKIDESQAMAEIVTLKTRLNQLDEEIGKLLSAWAPRTG